MNKIVLLGIVFAVLSVFSMSSIAFGSDGYIVDQDHIDNISLSGIGDTAFYVSDLKGNLIITSEGDRCISYIKITVIEEIIIPTIINNNVVDVVIGYEYKNVTRTIWFPCYYLDVFSNNEMLEVLEYKKQDLIYKEIGNIEGMKSVDDYVILGGVSL